MDARWQELMPTVLQAYLQWKYGSATAQAATDPGPPSEYDFEVDCINYLSDESTVLVRRTSTQGAVEALVLNGYLAATPDKPSIAISLDTLQLFHDIRRFKASYSVEAFTKMLCYKQYVARSIIPTHCSVAELRV